MKRLEFKEGDKVHYVYPYSRNIENGIVKSVRDFSNIVFVVYKCDNDWNNYEKYTAEPTPIKDIIHGWVYDE